MAFRQGPAPMYHLAGLDVVVLGTMSRASAEAESVGIPLRAEARGDNAWQSVESLGVASGVPTPRRDTLHLPPRSERGSHAAERCSCDFPEPFGRVHVASSRCPLCPLLNTPPPPPRVSGRERALRLRAGLQSDG